MVTPDYARSSGAKDALKSHFYIFLHFAKIKGATETKIQSSGRQFSD
jgi:hypothetical protein